MGKMLRQAMHFPHPNPNRSDSKINREAISSNNQDISININIQEKGVVFIPTGLELFPIDIFDSILSLNMGIIAHSSFTKVAAETFDTLSNYLERVLLPSMEEGEGFTTTGTDREFSPEELRRAFFSSGSTEKKEEEKEEGEENEENGEKGEREKGEREKGERMVVCKEEGDSISVGEGERQGGRQGEMTPSMPAKKARLLIDLTEGNPSPNSNPNSNLEPDPKLNPKPNYNRNPNTLSLYLSLTLSLEKTFDITEVSNTAPSNSFMDLAASLAEKLAKKENFDDVISLLYCPDKDTRMAFARLLLRAFQLLCVTG
jgi:hypothetical protein